jgi:hypothetical protein
MFLGIGAAERVRVGFQGTQAQALQTAPLFGTHLADVHQRASYEGVEARSMY